MSRYALGDFAQCKIHRDVPSGRHGALYQRVGRRLEVSLPLLHRITKLSAIAAAALLVGQYALEAARMADDMSGIVDPSLQMLAMHSASSVVLAPHFLGLVVILAAIDQGDVEITFSVICSTVAIGGRRQLS